MPLQARLLRRRRVRDVQWLIDVGSQGRTRVRPALQFVLSP
jgi:hypothetical protein